MRHVRRNPVNTTILLILFRSHLPQTADPRLVIRCFWNIIETHQNRIFPDLSFLKHVHEGLSEATEHSVYVSPPLRYAAWYQHSGREDDGYGKLIEHSVKRAQEQLRLLGVSESHIAQTVSLIRSTAPGSDLTSTDHFTFADANAYALCGLSFDRTNDIALRRIRSERYSMEQVQSVLMPEYNRLRLRQIYYLKHMQEQYGLYSRENITQTLISLSAYVKAKNRAHQKQRGDLVVKT